ncbi:putative ferric reductase transmembrane component [Fusarium oxysporum f. sp. raphani]|uniref:Putative ferric reductase transmembrane component n=1 Tax=Fusarium oxysporum f. sp. raphani TaxID=96318 RepID=A0A8J5Q0A7_FUSOX|nr:putative ferric reductase transmembrane component [Fusarium oxysporum f. sp. raphani]
MAGGSTHPDPAFAAKLARRQQLNYNAMVFFATAMTAFYFTMCIAILLRRLCVDLGASRKPNTATAIFRRLRASALVNIARLPSGGYTLAIFGYLVINTVVTFTYLDNDNMPLLSNMASRTGWMAIANLLIVVLLSLKNTPIVIFMTSSYERLNILHRITGYTTLIFAIVHSCSYAAVFGAQNFLQRLLAREEIFGMAAMGSFLVLGFAGAVLRTWWYELFYYLHVVFWILAVILTSLHQPEPSKKVLCVIFASAGIWVLDRIIRLARIIVNSANNTVTLTPLPNGGTRVTLAKAPYGSSSGKHGFLWIPGYAPLKPTLSPWLLLIPSIEGPYGNHPDVKGYDKVMLIAGGSGASFTVGATLDMLKRLDTDADVDIEFVWMIRKPTYFTWYADHVETLRRDHRVSTKIYVTRASETEIVPWRQLSSRSHASSSSTFIEPDPEKDVLPHVDTARLSLDIEKNEALSPAINASMGDAFHVGRPDVASLVEELIENLPSDKRVLVMGCGPRTLMSAVQDAAADCIVENRAGVELHLEQFGW